MKRRCGNCIYAHIAQIKEGDIGRTRSQWQCRFNPPNNDGWPHISDKDWCGKHELDLDHVREF